MGRPGRSHFSSGQPCTARVGKPQSLDPVAPKGNGQCAVAARVSRGSGVSRAVHWAGGGGCVCMWGGVQIVKAQETSG